MRALIQRVTKATASDADSKAVMATIAGGMMILVGFEPNDTLVGVEQIVQKIKNLRIFSDASGKMNLAGNEVSAQYLITSQFTLYADCRYGNRPSFEKAAEKGKAKELYEHFLGCARRIMGEAQIKSTAFGSMLHIELVNDGPVTLLIDSKELL